MPWPSLYVRLIECSEEYLLQLIGYSLLGVTPEEIFAFLYGPSNTGKSKFVECLRVLHGSYGTGASMETFSVSKGERHPTDLAGFVGRRLVTAAETEEGRRWDQQRLTTLTGRDRIQACFMRGDFFEYTPQFSSAPSRQLSSQTIWRVGRDTSSLALAAISAQAAKVDRYLIDKFRAELPVIMAMSIERCLHYQRVGLATLRIVTDAIEEYLFLEDQMAGWLEERCDRFECVELYAASRYLH